MSEASSQIMGAHEADEAAALGRRASLLVDTVLDYAIFLLSPEGVVESWNTGAAALKGYSADEVVGTHVSRFYPKEDVEAGLPQLLLRTAAEQGRIEHEGWRVRKDGSRFWADVIITAIRDEQGGLQGFAKVTRDLSERKEQEERLRASEERFRLLVEGVRDHAIFMLDPQGYVMSWNPGAVAIKGYTAREIIGQRFTRFYPPEDQAAGKPERLLRIAAEQGRVEDEGWRVRKDGSRFWADVILTALRDEQGELQGFAKVTRDLTERKQLEEERIRRAEAEAAIRLRDDFLSIASHELRTPLTALQLQLDGLDARLGEGDARLKRPLDRAIRSGERLAELVSTLLDVSRIASGRIDLHPETFSLGELVRDVAERFEGAAAEAGCPIELAIADEISGTWDRLRIEQVLVNLLSNATKFGAGAPVRIAVERLDDHAVIRVCDGGPGVPPGDLDRIFGRFERAAPIKHYGGLGLGLYVTWEIVTAHGGTVDAKNLPGCGAALTVRLPIGASAAEAG
ncbi:sensor histidine kinase [Vulgatibacter sp.]|uniref:sensor histidine kinase n=1 Tax=Vulgatibacter sp. TaxID=1971226 RepID=UPI003566B384